MKKFAYKQDAWTPLIGGFDTFEEAAKEFKNNFYYSNSLPYCKELGRIAIENGINPDDTEAVKTLFASFAVHEYNEPKN